MDSRKRCGMVATAGLPDDLLLEILSRVPAKSLCRFKCVSKAWRDLIADPIHRTKLPQAMEGLFFMENQIFCAGARDGCEGDQFSFVDLTLRSLPLDIDPCFSFLTELPGLQILALQDSCNGLLLFEHRPDTLSDYVLGYIVCNSTTKQWGTLPTCGCPPPPSPDRHIYLAFDSAVSPHFHLVLFHMHWGKEVGEEPEMSVHAYSSETRTWSHSQTDWDEHDRRGLKGWDQECFQPSDGPRHAFVNGMLHLLIQDKDLEHQILVMDVKGKSKRMIAMPAAVGGSCLAFDFISQSQGCLHYFNEVFDHSKQGYEVYIWVLQDYDLQEWVLKDRVNLLKLLGKMRWTDRVVAIHQDCNVVFFVQSSNHKLIAYYADRKDVTVFTTSQNQGLDWSVAAPYVPCFSVPPVLTNKH
ncbi:unnamed protein product [Urochloa decumbens]|uniref:F-box domain-containing protein n=1 Tax=Urochloa decumbens TaxID=240449 RepID=A0ABC9FN15_9POAL